MVCGLVLTTVTQPPCKQSYMLLTFPVPDARFKLQSGQSASVIAVGGDELSLTVPCADNEAALTTPMTTCVEFVEQGLCGDEAAARQSCKQSCGLCEGDQRCGYLWVLGAAYVVPTIPHSHLSIPSELCTTASHHSFGSS